MSFYIGVAKGNHGSYGSFWTGTVLASVLGVLLFLLIPAGLVGSCYLSYANYPQSPIWMILNIMVALGWLLVVTCLAGGLLGYF